MAGQGYDVSRDPRLSYLQDEVRKLLEVMEGVPLPGRGGPGEGEG